MDNKHPITPPPELVRQWWDGTHGAFYEYEGVAIEAARWGADQELKACCEWLEQSPYGFSVTANDVTDQLRDARRPKVPTLQEKALDILGKHGDLSPKEHDAIRIALENLSRKL